MLVPKEIHDAVTSKAEYLYFNEVIIDIFEDNLQKYVVDDLKKQMSLQSFQEALHRLSPINILPKVIDKLTNIYQTTVTREIYEGTETDLALLSYYESKMDINTYMNQSNELFNLCKATLLYPNVHKGKPQLTVIENDRFIPIASDPMHPTDLTHVILLGEKVNGVDTYWVWSDENFYITDADNKVRYDLMARYNNEEGINPIGRLPFVYINESKRKIMPKQDRDMLSMVKLIPIMLTDLNLAAMYQSFSITYGINVDDQNLIRAPNAFWSLKSDATTDQAPQIGTIKPDVDYQQVLSLIESQISMWLGTKGIKSSSIGSLTQDNFASGISKIIDEMDTFEARQKQTGYYKKAEKELWDLIMHSMHPYWVQSGQIEVTATFSPNAKVKTEFSVQLPQQSRGMIVKDVNEEYLAGFMTKRTALKRLNPELSDRDLDQLLIDLENESMATEELNAPTES